MVVSNSGPLIWLSYIHQFQLLRQLFYEVAIPEEVRAEVVDKATGYPSASNVIRACDEGWMKAIEVQDTQKVALLCAELHAAEAAAIVLAQELGAQALLVDELKARNIASEGGLQVIGTAGILLMAHERRIQIDLKELLDQMRQSGFYLSETVYRKILSRAGISMSKTKRR